MAISKIETDSLASGLVAPTATALTTASGSAPSYSARAWVNFNGTGTVAIRASGNVSSITDNGTGQYTINFTTAMPDANYCVSLTGAGITTNTDARHAIVINGSPASGAATKSTTALQILSGVTSSAVIDDSAEVNAAIFR
jgi:hypothetical protein